MIGSQDGSSAATPRTSWIFAAIAVGILAFIALGCGGAEGAAASPRRSPEIERARNLKRLRTLRSQYEYLRDAGLAFRWAEHDGDPKFGVMLDVEEDTAEFARALRRDPRCSFPRGWDAIHQYPENAFKWLEVDASLLEPRERPVVEVPRFILEFHADADGSQCVELFAPFDLPDPTRPIASRPGVRTIWSRTGALRELRKAAREFEEMLASMSSLGFVGIGLPSESTWEPAIRPRAAIAAPALAATQSPAWFEDHFSAVMIDAIPFNIEFVDVVGARPDRDFVRVELAHVPAQGLVVDGYPMAIGVASAVVRSNSWSTVAIEASHLLGEDAEPLATWKTKVCDELGQEGATLAYQVSRDGSRFGKILMFDPPFRRGLADPAGDFEALVLDVERRRGDSHAEPLVTDTAQYPWPLVFAFARRLEEIELDAGTRLRLAPGITFDDRARAALDDLRAGLEIKHQVTRFGRFERIDVLDAGAANATVYTDPGTLIVTLPALHGAMDLEIAGLHEGFHALDDRVGISEASDVVETFEQASESTLAAFSERHWFAGAAVGHASDSVEEAVASCLATACIGLVEHWPALRAGAIDEATWVSSGVESLRAHIDRLDRRERDLYVRFLRAIASRIEVAALQPSDAPIVGLLRTFD